MSDWDPMRTFNKKMILLFLALLARCKDDEMTPEDMHALLDRIEELQRRIKRNKKIINKFASRFDFLTDNDQKLKNKLNYLQEKRWLQKIATKETQYKLEIVDKAAMKDNLYVIKNQQSFFGKLLNKKSMFSFTKKSTAYTNKIIFDETKDNDCLVDSFYIEFTKDGDNYKSLEFNLKKNQPKQIFELPFHTMFDRLDIIPINNQANETDIFCIPQVHAYGSYVINNDEL